MSWTLNRKKISTDLDDVKIHDHIDGVSYFMLESVHLEAHSFEDKLSTSRI